MTQNQISYWKLQEDIRSHKAEEAENYRSHKANEYIGFGTLAESMRHNMASEALAGMNYQEAARHNKAVEYETGRSNLAQEALKHEANMYNREVGMYSANVQREVGMANVAESSRHNQAMEGLQLGKQNEEARHNVASEEYNYYKTNSEYQLRSKANELKEAENAIKAQEADIKERTLAETITHNRNTESYEGLRTGAGAVESIARTTDTFIRLAPLFVIP